MANIYKLELYVTDSSEYYESTLDLLYAIQSGLYIPTVNCFNSEVKNIEWNNEIDIAKVVKTEDDLKRVFE